MKTTELRLGNWVLVMEGTEPVQVRKVDFSGIWYTNGDERGWASEAAIQPIPLNEEMKLHGTRTLGGRLRPEYLHDLQNLYFATCRAELELNPEAVKAYVDTLKTESK